MRVTEGGSDHLAVLEQLEQSAVASREVRERWALLGRNAGRLDEDTVL